MKTSIIAAGILGLSLSFAALAGPVNVNTADAKTIAKELKGVGMAKAQAIVKYRESHGPFHSLKDLEQVKGIGTGTITANKGDILFGDSHESGQD